MNSKDFGFIAKSLSQNIETMNERIERVSQSDDLESIKLLQHQLQGMKFVAQNLAGNLDRKHDNFDKKLFLKACGL